MTIRAAAIIPAAGTGSRMGLERPKQFQHLAGIPLLIHTVRAFLFTEGIEAVIIAVPSNYDTETRELLNRYFPDKPSQRKLQVVIGGATRQDSVRAGLAVLPESLELALIHDGARPLVTPEIISACIKTTAACGAAVIAIPVNDTLKAVARNNTVVETIDRRGLWQAQTPQGAKVELLKRAFAAAEAQKLTANDEAALLENIGQQVAIVMGSRQNIKITRPEDLLMAEALLAQRLSQEREMATGPEMRIGHGYDAHRLTPGRPLVLGGVTIPHPTGLLGHSDADVLTHALCDAVLGAAGLGDIGNHFPDTDPQFKDIKSLHFLEQVIARIADQGWVLANGDITVVAQLPKLSPYFAAMQKNLAACCRVEPQVINLKASTTEKMGFAGREEGMAAHAVVLLRRRSKTSVRPDR
jgi:2-C-methyl-D-erythritol 4-phosphate cytidylyltransferase/2-C-methyl-D-erythritol 2,4-cyclodiphosphate synthase